MSLFLVKQRGIMPGYTSKKLRKKIRLYINKDKENVCDETLAFGDLEWRVYGDTSQDLVLSLSLGKNKERKKKEWKKRAC